MIGRVSSRTCNTKLSYDFPYVRSLSLRRDSYTDFVKYLGLTFTGSHKDDNKVSKQVSRPILYPRCKNNVTLFH